MPYHVLAARWFTLNAAPTQALPLRNIHLPADIGWWPLAPGWYIVAILVITSLSILAWMLHRYIKRNRYRKVLLKELQTASKNGEPISQLANALMRRASREAYGLEKVSLHGEQWQLFLQQQCDKQLADTALAALAIHCYAPNYEEDSQAIFDTTKTWLQHHSRELKC